MKSLRVVLTFLLLVTGVPGVIHAHQSIDPTIKDRASLPSKKEADLTGYVNPFIGTDGSGNTFPGTALPFGMIQWSPDTTSNGFYKYQGSTIRGFSLTHLSGVGCPIFGDIPFLPIVGPIRASPATNPSDYSQSFSHNNEQAAPGFYSVNSSSGIQVKLSVTARTGLGVFTYPSTEEANLLINAGGSATGNSMSSVQVIGEDRVVGSAMSGGFCGSNTVYTIYFAVQFDRPFSSFGTWNAGAVNPRLRSSTSKQSGAFLTFDTRQNPMVKAKVGISFVSVENALLNLKTENSGWDFDAVRRKARTTWNEWLSRIEVDEGTREQKQIFYTALYHSLLSPNVFSDANGDYIGFDRMIHQARGYQHYTNISDWDTYRSQVQLQALLAPRETSDMVQSLIVDAEQSGWLPKWVLANDVTAVMGGDNPVPLITSAYAFGARKFDKGSALKYMLKAATQPGVGIHGYRERPRLAEYFKGGYVPYSSGFDSAGVNSASVTLEYATDDFCIAQFARSLGDAKTHNAFMQRAQNWQNLFDAEIGFIRPRRENGVFLEGFDADDVLPRSEVPWDKNNQAGFQEGNSWQYTWMLPYNYKGLFQAIGGNAEVTHRLDRFFKELTGWGRPHFNMANEPSFVSPYAYTFAGSPWKTQQTVRRIMTETFKAAPDGLPGNDDLGATSAWYVWSAIGLYPAIPGVGGFVIGSPSFSSVKIRLGDGRQIHIVADGKPPKNPYVQSLTLNGKPYSRTWLPVESFRSSTSILKFTLAGTPNPLWGSAVADMPPSFTIGQSPAIGFIYGDDYLSVTPGGEAKFSLGVQKIVPESLTLKWSAVVPRGLELRPSSGLIRITGNEKPKVDVQVISSTRILPDSYIIPIRFQLISPVTLKDVKFPETIVEIKVGDSIAKSRRGKQRVRARAA
ncbi:MAG: glycoside hydrolase family 92 protein [Blastocatellia bacterium]|nr:glycoside hydrolase family 92 protein [Blastocatellia bacterium]